MASVAVASAAVGCTIPTILKYWRHYFELETCTDLEVKQINTCILRSKRKDLFTNYNLIMLFNELGKANWLEQDIQDKIIKFADNFLNLGYFEVRKLKIFESDTVRNLRLDDVHKKKLNDIVQMYIDKQQAKWIFKKKKVLRDFVKLGKKFKEMQRIRRVSEEKAAATRIQATSRRTLAKKQVTGMRKAAAEKEAATRIQATSRRFLTNMRERKAAAATRIQATRRRTLAKKQVTNMRKAAAEKEAATRIQATSRRFLTNMRERKAAAATRIQTTRRRTLAKKQVTGMRERIAAAEKEAATRIQATSRRFLTNMRERRSAERRSAERRSAERRAATRIQATSRLILARKRVTNMIKSRAEEREAVEKSRALKKLTSRLLPLVTKKLKATRQKKMDDDIRDEMKAIRYMRAPSEFKAWLRLYPTNVPKDVPNVGLHYDKIERYLDNVLPEMESGQRKRADKQASDYKNITKQASEWYNKLYPLERRLLLGKNNVPNNITKKPNPFKLDGRPIHAVQPLIPFQPLIPSQPRIPYQPFIPEPDDGAYEKMYIDKITQKVKAQHSSRPKGIAVRVRTMMKDKNKPIPALTQIPIHSRPTPEDIKNKLQNIESWNSVGSVSNSGDNERRTGEVTRSNELRRLSKKEKERKIKRHNSL